MFRLTIPRQSCSPPASSRGCLHCQRSRVLGRQSRVIRDQVRAQRTDESGRTGEAGSNEQTKAEIDQTTLKWGLEAGLWKALTSQNKTGVSKGQQAKDLLKRYGGAYLLTSISFAIVSFSACYALVSAGVNVQLLLSKIGLNTGETGEKVGTFAIAYAAHKALSPVRFPPTVALTPVVARWIGKSPAPVEDEATTP